MTLSKLKTFKTLVLAGATVLGTGAGLALPTAAQAQGYINVQIGTPPPAPRYEVMPAPRAGHVWAPGHYEWVGNHHVWRRGHWVQARPGYTYVPAAWQASGNQWVYQPPRWAARPVTSAPRAWDHRGRPHARPGWQRDNDGDGVPNRYDRRPNDPYRR